MPYKQYTTVTGSNDDLEDLEHFSACDLDSVEDTWFITMTNTATSYTFNFWSITDPTDASVNEGTEVVSPAFMTANYVVGRPIIRCIGTDYFDI